MKITDIIYPTKCVFCGKLLKSSEYGYCEKCRDSIPYVTEPVCFRCGKPLADYEKEYCLNCEGLQHSMLDGGRAVWVYDDMTRPAMVDFKYGGNSEDASVFADEVVSICYDYLQKCSPNVIVPVPVHRKRFRYRGYNQAERLSLEIGARIGVQTRNLIKRTYYTPPMKSLSAEERKKNLLKAFEADEEKCAGFTADTALLVDDIYTTGSTVEICAGVLKSIGIKKVYAVYMCIGKDY
ncbi:MAG: ComF family protein [Eubacterium sp.]|nr:ComF family protein [Eubacterium sp.]